MKQICFCWILLAAVFIKGGSAGDRSRQGSSAGNESLTWYQYYTNGGGTITEGLVADGDHFTLNGLEMQILSGTVHYFRVHPDYWRVTLRKLRAAGLNTVETYVAWNLHEPEMDVYDFGDGGRDMSMFLDLPGYLKMAQEEDLFVILRPGPYICAEWDFGGLPSYLLRQYNVHVRSWDERFLSRVEAFFTQLLPKVANLQFTNGGPIIMVQVENEFGHFGYSDFPRDKKYLAHVKELMTGSGIKELLFTSDSPSQNYDWGTLPGVLQTANFQKDVDAELDTLKRLQPGRPLMTMEFWSGWFDHWFAPFKAGFDPAGFREALERILSHNSSVNQYMFMGGTNWGFLAGANWLGTNPSYAPDTTSYDYDAPLSEGGRYTEKYNITKELFQKFSAAKNIKQVEPPEENPVTAYDYITLTESVAMETLYSQLTHESSDQLISMEQLTVNNGSGQSYGLVWYRANITTKQGSKLKICGHVRDLALVVIDGQLLTKKPENMAAIESFGYWPVRDASVTLTCEPGEHTLDILVENMGRVNYGEPHILNFQRKGLYEGPVEIDGAAITRWEISPMELKRDWINSLEGWAPAESPITLPTLLRGNLSVETPADTYLDMRQLTKGAVFVNGFNLGRYLIAGPVYSLYLPAPLLKAGDNEIIVFEEFGTENPVINFSTVPITKQRKDEITEEKEEQDEEVAKTVEE